MVTIFFSRFLPIRFVQNCRKLLKKDSHSEGRGCRRVAFKGGMSEAVVSITETVTKISRRRG